MAIMYNYVTKLNGRYIMKGIKKLITVALGVLLSTSVFTGCSNNGTTLYNAINKTQSLTDSEVKSDISLNISGDNLSPQQQKVMTTVVPLINASKLSIVTDNYENEDNTKAQTSSDITITGPIKLNMGLWIDADITNDTPTVNEVFKMPKILTNQLPNDFKGKDYMIMDYNNMSNVKGAPQIDFKKLMEFDREFQPKLLQFMAEYIKQFNPNLNIINKVDAKYIGEPSNPQFVDIYELKLDDKTFKDLMHYTLNNFAENKDAIAFIKGYMTSLTSIMGLSQNQENFEQLPQMITQLDKELDTLNNIKILGDKGITIQYAINYNGYIVNESGNAEFIINLPELSKNNSSSSEQNSQKLTGIYTVDLNFNSDYQALNSSNHVVIPTLTNNNSFNYTDLLKTISKQTSIK